jgi:hypothetical protein
VSIDTQKRHIVTSTRNPAALAAGAEHHVDPGAVAFPVFKASEPPEMLSRGRSDVSTRERCEPALSLVALSFSEAAAAGQPEMASAFLRGFHYQSVILPGSAKRDILCDVIKEDQRPGVAPSWSDVDLPLASVLSPGPGQREVVEKNITVPEHGSI